MDNEIKMKKIELVLTQSEGKLLRHLVSLQDGLDRNINCQLKIANALIDSGSWNQPTEPLVLKLELTIDEQNLLRNCVWDLDNEELQAKVFKGLGIEKDHEHHDFAARAGK